MKKQIVVLGIASLLGMGAFTLNASASDQEKEVKSMEYVYKDINRGKKCNNLSEEQRKLLEKGYNELSDKEKESLNKYRGQCRNLTEEELSEYYAILDKMHKYMDEDFKTEVKEKREQIKDRHVKGKRQGQRRGKCVN